MEKEAVVGAVETAEQFAARRDALINNWLAEKQRSTAAVEAERGIRANLTTLLFPTPVKGTQRYALNAGYNIKLVHGMTYTLGDKDMIDPATNTKVPIETQVEAVLKEISDMGNEGPLLAERLVKWKPELSESEYLKLDITLETDRKIKDLIDSILTIKPSSPQLTFEEPKAKK